MKTITLPISLEPQQEFPLIRVGSDRDGGYLIDQRLLGSDLLSFGISGDWQFEKDWLALAESKCRIVTYDGSIGAVKFICTAIASSFRLNKPALVFRNWSTLIDYHRFLKAKTCFHQKFITHSWSDHNHETFLKALQHPGLKHPIFLKMDIEGAEYELLDQIVQNQDNIAGIAIEFHDPLSNIDVISHFAAELKLRVTNVHANNCLPKKNKSNTEPSIEISFSRYMGIAERKGLPHPLECDNDPSCPPLEIRWA